eukprot:c19444_g1_i2 orf=2-517(-)
MDSQQMPSGHPLPHTKRATQCSLLLFLSNSKHTISIEGKEDCCHNRNLSAGREKGLIRGWGGPVTEIGSQNTVNPLSCKSLLHLLHGFAISDLMIAWTVFSALMICTQIQFEDTIGFPGDMSSLFIANHNPNLFHIWKNTHSWHLSLNYGIVFAIRPLSCHRCVAWPIGILP